MKATFLTLLLSAAAACAQGAPTTAAAPAPTAQGATAQAGESVPASLMRLSFVQGKPAMDAKYYIYVQSASWCGPCRKFMPIIVDLYETLKAQGVEIILVGRDSTEKQTQDYANGHNVAFPVLQWRQGLEGTLPGFSNARGIPHIQVVDKGGRVMLDGHPQNFFSHNKWKDLLQEWKANPSASVNPDMDDEKDQYDMVVRNISDMEDILYTMARHMRSSQNFQSRIPNPGDMVMETMVANDIMAGYGISEKDGVYTLVPAYLDSWRMLHAFTYQKTQGIRSSNDTYGGWGNKLSVLELKVLVDTELRLKKLLRPGMSDAEKVLAIHDDWVNRATLIKDDNAPTSCLVSTLRGGCDAYTRYMYLALNMAGVSCHRVVGTDGFHHSWNMVKIDNRWYHLDAAWDDPDATTAGGQPKALLCHEFCCVSDATIAKDHKWNRSIYPEAKTDYPFPFRREIATPQALKTALKKAYRSGAPMFEAKVAFRDFSVLKNPGCPVEGYAVTDPDNGYIVVYFDRTESGTAPVEWKVKPKPVDSPEAAAMWQNVRLGK